MIGFSVPVQPGDIIQAAVLLCVQMTVLEGCPAPVVCRKGSEAVRAQDKLGNDGGSRQFVAVGSKLCRVVAVFALLRRMGISFLFPVVTGMEDTR